MERDDTSFQTLYKEALLDSRDLKMPVFPDKTDDV